MTGLICLIILLVPFSSGAALGGNEPRSKNITEFFPEAKGNLTKISWAHAVNSKELLATALNETVMMLEADVILGKLTADGEEMPVMGHPPATTSDISLADFLTKIDEFNTVENQTHRKGVKLDFKSIEVFEKSVAIVEAQYQKMDYPIWLNADILRGPINATNDPVDATKFIEGSKKFPNATLSLGWTTNLETNNTIASYTAEQVQEMIQVIQDANISQPITFPVRAAIAANSTSELTKLVKKIGDSTLTLWNGKDDDVDIANLRGLIKEIGVDKTYVDLPEELLQKLRLDQMNGVGVAKPLALLLVVLVAFVRLL